MDLGNLSPDKLTDQVKKWEEELGSLKDKAEGAVGDAKAKYEDQIKNIQAKIGGAKDKIEELKGKGKDILGKFGS